MDLLRNIVNIALLNFFKENFAQELHIENEKIKVVEANNSATVTISLKFNLGDYTDKLKTFIVDSIKKNNIAKMVQVDINTAVNSHKLENHVQGKPTIKNIIAISSAKGGVGKSTMTANLALAMHNLGAKVGLIDADIHGPSQPMMLGVTPNDLKKRKDGLSPVNKHGIDTASISYFMTKDDPIVWRGPMVSRALEQLINDLSWPELDYVFIDMPPGTGDIALTLVKKLPLTAAVIVTTPQDVACLDAKKSLQMYAKTNTPVLGIIENMSYHICENCGEQSNIFGEGGGNDLANFGKVPFLGQVPLQRIIREAADVGRPIFLDNEELKAIYEKISLRIAMQLSLRPLDYMRNFPKVISE
ncbi:MAG: Mrp/NBP35 family ATP-binding protein [Pseudomonadota bacterium]|nr:Mrp/NBP35 family ATP-binding protein [Pseudomonadota bacterium]